MKLRELVILEAVAVLHNIDKQTPLGSFVKEIDDNPEQEMKMQDLEDLSLKVLQLEMQVEGLWLNIEEGRARNSALIQVVKDLQANAYGACERLNLRVANLETQRTPQDNNRDDMEWF